MFKDKINVSALIKISREAKKIELELKQNNLPREIDLTNETRATQPLIYELQEKFNNLLIYVEHKIK